MPRPCVLAGKRLEILHEVIPDLGRLAILANADNPGAVLELRAVEESARTMGWSITTLEIRQAEDIPLALKGIGAGADALYVGIDPVTNASRGIINSLALDARLPTMHGQRGFVETGGLVSYGADFPDLWRRAAELVDKVLRGAKPADIPVEQPVKFELVINLKTARALGLEIPPTLLAPPTRRRVADANPATHWSARGTSLQCQRFEFTVGIGGRADMKGRAISANSDATDPAADMGEIQIPQRSSAGMRLPFSVGSTGGHTAVKRREFITI